MKHDGAVSDPTDAQLVEQFRRNGDRLAFNRLVERHEPWIRRVCARLLRSDDRARDATQEVFARVLEHLGTWRGDNFPAWLKVIAVNASLTMINRERRWAPIEHAGDTPDERANPEVVLSKTQESARARRLIAKLPERQRLVFVMKYIDGCSYLDIERLTGFTDKEVKSYLQNARRNFGNWWREEEP